MPNKSFQRGTKGGEKSRSYTFKVRGPAVDGDTERRTKALTIRCDGGRAQSGACKLAKKYAVDAEKLASQEYTADEEHPDKRKKKPVEPPPF